MYYKSCAIFNYFSSLNSSLLFFESVMGGGDHCSINGVYASASTSSWCSSFTLVSLALDQSGFFCVSWMKKKKRKRFKLKNVQWQLLASKSFRRQIATKFLVQHFQSLTKKNFLLKGVQRKVAADILNQLVRILRRR